jgi:protein-tyrosine phosphatase
MYCNLSTQQCNCIREDPDHEGTLYCYTCNDIREFDVFDTNLDFDAIVGTLVEEGDGEFEHYVDIADAPIKSAKSSADVFLGKCRHRNFPITFPDGTIVYASSEHHRNTDDIAAPDLALYLDWSWRPTGPSYFLDWRDYGLPSHWEAAAKTITDVFQRAQQNLWVEIGCIGGHGRTGTAVAAMAVLGGVPADEAVEWVQTNYCKHAVETGMQAWWVEWFAAWFNATDCPPYPRYDTTTKQTTLIDVPSYEGREEVYDLNDPNFHGLWIDAHTAEEVDTSEKVIQQEWSAGNWDDTDYSDPDEWQEELWPVGDGNTFPIHWLSDIGYKMLTEYLEKQDERTLQYVARFYFASSDKINSFSAVQAAVKSYEAETPEEIDHLLAMDLSEFIQSMNDGYAGSYSHTLGNKLFTFFYKGQDDVEESDIILDSLDGEAEEWLSKHLSEEYDLLELVEAVKAFDAQAEPF